MKLSQSSDEESTQKTDTIESGARALSALVVVMLILVEIRSLEVMKHMWNHHALRPLDWFFPFILCGPVIFYFSGVSAARKLKTKDLVRDFALAIVSSLGIILIWDDMLRAAYRAGGPLFP